MAQKANIQVDQSVATALDARAVALGLTVSEFLETLMHSGPSAGEIADSALAELEKSWEQTTLAGTVAHEDVAAWLQTWGTEQFRPWGTR